MECLCKLFETAGAGLDRPEAAVYMNTYFERMQEVADNKTLSVRVRFMMQVRLGYGFYRAFYASKSGVLGSHCRSLSTLCS